MLKKQTIGEHAVRDQSALCSQAQLWIQIETKEKKILISTNKLFYLPNDEH